jgi:hypothetical protein
MTALECPPSVAGLLVATAVPFLRASSCAASLLCLVLPLAGAVMTSAPARFLQQHQNAQPRQPPVLLLAHLAMV